MANIVPNKLGSITPEPITLCNGFFKYFEVLTLSLEHSKKCKKWWFHKQQENKGVKM